MWCGILEPDAHAEGCGKNLDSRKPMQFWVDPCRFPRVEARASPPVSRAAVAAVGRLQVRREALYCSVRYFLIQPPRIHSPCIHLKNTLPCFVLLSLLDEFTWISDPLCLSFLIQNSRKTQIFILHLVFH